MDFSKIRQLSLSAGVPEGKLTDRYLFTVYCADLFFFNQNIGLIDIKTGFTDGSKDGGIDFIYSDGDVMYLIQGKSSQGLDKEDILNLFTKMSDAIRNFNEGEYSSYSEQMKTAYLNSYDGLSDEKNIELVLFTNTKLTPFLQAEFEKTKKDPKLSEYKLTLYDSEDIANQEALLFDGAGLIHQGEVKMFHNDDCNTNLLAYGDNGVIVNVYASSIKKLYEKYKTKGLFSFNLREHIVQKDVDDAIELTINKDKDNFWFYNNGITIGCKSFRKDGWFIKLEDFSIINGAQTTTKIGKSIVINEDYDFPLVCKIVQSDIADDESFISKISEASNSQKPIKARDLRANSLEQKRLQQGCASNGDHSLAVEIKRGVKPKNYKKVESWQKVSNEYVGQLIYACIFQRPGPARNAKNLLFSSNEKYNQVFRRQHDYNTIFDLVRLGKIYEEYLADISSTSSDIDEIAVAKNGKFTVLALCIFELRKKRSLISDRESSGLRKDNITGLLVSDYNGDDLDQKLWDLYKFLLRTCKRIYDSNKVTYKFTSYSNFFKSEQGYDLLLKELDNLDDYDREKIDLFLKVLTDKKTD